MVEQIKWLNDTYRSKFTEDEYKMIECMNVCFLSEKTNVFYKWKNVLWLAVDVDRTAREAKKQKNKKKSNECIELNMMLLRKRMNIWMTNDKTYNSRKCDQYHLKHLIRQNTRLSVALKATHNFTNEEKHYKYMKKWIIWKCDRWNTHIAHYQ